MGKRKYYVVWAGVTPGVYDTWTECKEQVDGFKGSKYKSFETKREADRVYKLGYDAYMKEAAEKKGRLTPGLSDEPQTKPILHSISVDASYSSLTSAMEYRGVWTHNGEEIFHEGPFYDATNNTGEFLALVHGLAHVKKYQIEVPIYSDSVTAMAWVRNKTHNSNINETERNKRLMNLLERANKWLHENNYITPVFKWNTKEWGEIPADFGRK